MEFDGVMWNEAVWDDELWDEMTKKQDMRDPDFIAQVIVHGNVNIIDRILNSYFGEAPVINVTKEQILKVRGYNMFDYIDRRKEWFVISDDDIVAAFNEHVMYGRDKRAKILYLSFMRIKTHKRFIQRYGGKNKELKKIINGRVLNTSQSK